MRRIKSLDIPLTDEEKAMLSAASGHMPLTTWARWILLNAAKDVEK